MLATAAAVGGFVIDRGASGGSRDTAATSPPAHAVVSSGSSHVRNGALTVLAVPLDSQADGPAGYYAFSEIGRHGEPHVFVRCPGKVAWCGEVESVAWAPDGRRLAVSTTSFGRANPYNGIHVIDTVTGADHQIRSCRPPECDWTGLAWSPRGSRLAYSTNGVIYVMRADGSGRRALNTGTKGSDYSPSWSPDGRGIVYTDEADHGIDLVSVDGGTGSLLARNATSPDWSPNGRRIAYRTASCGIGLVTPSGRNVAPLRASGCRGIGKPGSPEWSPDGRRIAIATYTRTYVMNADGSHLVELPTPDGVNLGEEPRPSWQPIPPHA